MLKSLDILISFSVAMLVASLAVTVLTQLWTAIFNTRGMHLREGLANLLKQLHFAFSPAEANAIADYVLRHPLVREGEDRLGTVIHRDELTRLLLEAASAPNLSALIKTALTDALSQNGVANPEATLRKIRQQALELETSCPALAQAARHDLAILHVASSEFVAKINGWFDRSMDRVSARFTMSTRRVTLLGSFLVAVVIQMDSVAIVNGLNVFPVAKSPQDWLNGWHITKLPGVAISVLLLSLGAPFWFEVLKDLLKLRSTTQQEIGRKR